MAEEGWAEVLDAGEPDAAGMDAEGFGRRFAPKIPPQETEADIFLGGLYPSVGTPR